MASLWRAAALTVGVECLWFFCMGFRTWKVMLYCAAVNILTNIPLNLLCSALMAAGIGRGALIAAVYVSEALIVLIEYHLFAQLETRSARLFALVLTANALSYIVGMLCFGHI